MSILRCQCVVMFMDPDRYYEVPLPYKWCYTFDEAFEACEIFLDSNVHEYWIEFIDWDARV